MAAVFVCEEVSKGAGWILLWPRFSPISFVCSLHVWVALEINCFYCVHSGKPNAKKRKKKTPPAFSLKTMLTKASRKWVTNQDRHTNNVLYFFSGALNDILRLRNSSPHVALSKTTSSMPDASPQKMSEGAEAETEHGKSSSSETKTKTNKTCVCLQRRGTGKTQSGALFWRLMHRPGQE